jgi:hypothetical protein
MRIAVKKGTSSWRAWEGEPAQDEVIFDGDVTETMVWGDDVQNLREPTTAEQAAIARRNMPTLTPAQLDLALLHFGLLDTVEAFVAAADRATQIAYRRVQTFERSNPLLNAAAQQLGMTDEQMDGIWMFGAAITPGA